MNTKVLKNDELTPEFSDVNGFILEDGSLVFTALVLESNSNSNGSNLVTLTLKSSGEHYLLKSVTLTDDNDVIYTATRGKLANQ